MPKISRAAIALCAVLSVLLLFACAGQGVQNKGAVPNSSELKRVTSPNGQLDAVLLVYMYGPAAGGGVDSNVYIVRKGAPVNMKDGREVFSADPMTGGELTWKRDHLLEIHYDVANIHKFRNVWELDEVENVASAEGDFGVEIRLMPLSDSSALTPNGAFRNPY